MSTTGRQLTKYGCFIPKGVITAFVQRGFILVDFVQQRFYIYIWTSVWSSCLIHCSLSLSRHVCHCRQTEVQVLWFQSSGAGDVGVLWMLHVLWSPWQGWKPPVVDSSALDRENSKNKSLV